MIKNVIIIKNYHIFMTNFHNFCSSIVQDRTICSPTHQQFNSKQSGQIQLICTYLTLNDKQLSFSQAEDKQEVDEHSDISTIQHNIEKQRQNQKNSLEKQKQKSIFHNFQKHLIVTLKKDIKMPKNIDKDVIVAIAKILWIIFTSSNLFSKKVLNLLFGVNNFQEQNFREILSFQISGSKQLMDNCSKSQFTAAQQYLRNEVVKQGRKLLLTKLLRHRKIIKNEQYKIFFCNFLEELQIGPLSRRILKAEKIKIMEQMTIRQLIKE